MASLPQLQLQSPSVSVLLLRHNRNNLQQQLVFLAAREAALSAPNAFALFHDDPLGQLAIESDGQDDHHERRQSVGELVSQEALAIERNDRAHFLFEVTVYCALTYWPERQLGAFIIIIIQLLCYHYWRFAWHFFALAFFLSTPNVLPSRLLFLPLNTSSYLLMS